MSRTQDASFICRASLAASFLACAMTLSACATTNHATAGHESAYWLGRNIDELIGAAGQPMQIYAAKPTHGFAYIWPPVDDCIVVFVTDASGTVIDLMRGSVCQPGT